MKSVLSIKTANGSMIRLGAADDVSNSILETTARIHETDFPRPESLSGSAFPDVILHSGAPLPDGVSAEPLLQAGGVEIFRAGNRFRFRISGQVPEGWEESLRYRLPLLHAVMLATLSGSECCLFHGCLLLNSNGEGVILTGESEVGKSTTFRRWLNSGGEGLCDDLMILSCVREENGKISFYAQPLPTWSRCLREGVPAKEMRCPVTRTAKIRRILWLTRSATDREELTGVSIQKWHGQLLAACNQHTLFLQQALTMEERRRLALECWKIVDEIDKAYSPLALAAHLDGDLRKTLEKI